MFSLFAGVLRAAALAALLFGPAALAHGDEDHGVKPDSVANTGAPRVAASSETYELVGLLKGSSLRVYLDRFDTNEPVPDAKLMVTLGGDEEVQARREPDGTYEVASGKLAGTGPLELVFTVTASSGDDLLIGTLNLPNRAEAAMAAPSQPAATWAERLVPWRDSLAAWLRASPAIAQLSSAAVVLTFALGLSIGLLIRSGWRLVPATGVGGRGRPRAHRDRLCP